MVGTSASPPTMPSRAGTRSALPRRRTLVGPGIRSPPIRATVTTGSTRSRVRSGPEASTARTWSNGSSRSPAPDGSGTASTTPVRSARCDLEFVEVDWPRRRGDSLPWNEDQSVRQGSTRSMPVRSKSFVFRVASKRSFERQIEAICASKPSIGCPRRSRVSTICE